MLIPADGERMEVSAVNSWVSDARNQGPQCIEAAEV
jgi:hypothetical protein